MGGRRTVGSCGETERSMTLRPIPATQAGMSEKQGLGDSQAGDGFPQGHKRPLLALA